jgi:hypothetical protein
MPTRTRKPPGAAAFWVVAFLVMVAAGAWEWHAGAVRPRRGEVMIAGQSVPYQLPGAAIAGEPLRVTVGAGPEVAGTMRWRHDRAGKEFQGLTMLRDGDVLVSLLPAQPAGGRIEYQLVLVGPFGLARIPSDEPIAIRSRGRASALVVLPYIAVALVSLLVGVRAGLAALFARPEVRVLTWVTAGCVTLGGLILGPVVQRSTLGAFWSGFPFGPDPIDNGTLVVWLAWVVAAATMASARGATDRFARAVVMTATVALVALALLPRSLHLSRVDAADDAGAYSTEGSLGRPSSS